MKRFDFKIPLYEWNISVVTIYDEHDEQSLEALLNEIKAPQTGIDQELHYVRNHFMDGGDTWRDFDNRRALIIIFPWSDMGEFWETINHEKRHLVDRILEWANISDTEAAAYLDGYISKTIFSNLEKLL